jgi:L-lysine exporter family protein LysE/ArgO
MIADIALIPLLQGIVLGAGICCTLGPQSVFVLRQGIHGKAALGVAAICTLADCLLIGIAAAGAGAIILLLPQAASIGLFGSAAFIATFGAVAIVAAFRPRPANKSALSEDKPRTSALTAALALSLLNPQVYVEMVALVGAIALQFPPMERILFVIGVGLVSPVWFFGLAVGGRQLSRFLNRPRALLAIDLTTGLVMIGLAASIVIGELHS